jgi:hypothetical protein
MTRSIRLSATLSTAIAAGPLRTRPSQINDPLMKRTMNSKLHRATRLLPVLVSSVAAGALVLGACGSTDPTESEEYRKLNGELSAVESERDDVRARVDELESANTTLQGEVDELNGKLETVQAELTQVTADRDQLQADLTQRTAERDDAIRERDDARSGRRVAIKHRRQAVSERDEAVSRADELRQLYDPQIQAAIAAVTQQALDAACAAGDAAGFEGTQPPSIEDLIANAASGLPQAERESAIQRLDRGAVRSKLAECQAAGESRRAAAALTEPHGDGLWTVGVEIAPGTWRSTGTADDCYWQRSPDGNPDDIIDNHFGLAGGTVTINAGEEFETEDCGTWELVS